MTWRNLSGPLFGNTIATLSLDADATPRCIFEQPREDGELTEVARIPLTD